MECCILERNYNEWFLIVENADAPLGAYDWKDYATAYGPFYSIMLAQDYLAEHFPQADCWIMEHAHYSLLSAGRRQKYEDLVKWVKSESICRER
jgi:hypothetical protein